LGFYERGNGALESGIALPVGSKSRKVCFEAAFPGTTASQEDLDGFVQQLIRGTPFDLTPVFEGGSLLSLLRINSQSERIRAILLRLVAGTW
jgi:hypothetical protein